MKEVQKNIEVIKMSQLNNEFNNFANNLEVHDLSSNKRLDLDEFAVVYHEVSRENVKRRSIKNIVRIIETLEKSQKEKNQSLTVFFEDYPQEEKALFEIREVRRWVSKLVKNKPHIFYYLCDQTETALLFYQCISNIEVIEKINGNFLYKIITDYKQEQNIIQAVLEHSESRGDSSKKKEEVLIRVLRALNFNI